MTVVMAASLAFAQAPAASLNGPLLHGLILKNR
jgi:hypothetical protein